MDATSIKALIAECPGMDKSGVKEAKAQRLLDLPISMEKVVKQRAGKSYIEVASVIDAQSWYTFFRSFFSLHLVWLSEQDVRQPVERAQKEQNKKRKAEEKIQRQQAENAKKSKPWVLGDELECCCFCIVNGSYWLDVFCLIFALSLLLLCLIKSECFRDNDANRFPTYVLFTDSLFPFFSHSNLDHENLFRFARCLVSRHPLSQSLHKVP